MKGAISFLLIVTIYLCGCNKLVDTSPETTIDGNKLFTNDQSAEAAMVGLYQKCMTSFSLLNGYLSRYGSLYADDVLKTNISTADNYFYNVALLPGDNTIQELWSSSYNYIYQCNLVLEKLTASNAVSKSMKAQLAGESKFMRSLVYFYLVNMFGDVPLVLDADPDKTANLPRSPKSIVYRQIAEDLRSAQSLLSNNYPANNDVPSNRIRPNKAAALALLARVCLFSGDDNNAIVYSSAVIDSGLYSLPDNLNNVFIAQSAEIIFAMYPVSTLYNTAEGRIFGYSTTMAKPAFVLSATLLNGFENGDLRKGNWIRTVSASGNTYAIPYKYKVYESDQVSEYDIVLRLAELYFIRAEAYLHNGNTIAAIGDINKIRKRAGLLDMETTLTAAEVQTAIEKEKQKEFFCEFGHRWFDIRRWPANDPASAGKTRADEILSIIKPDNWKSYKLLWPLPQTELLKSKTLTQNPGYN